MLKKFQVGHAVLTICLVIGALLASPRNGLAQNNEAEARRIAAYPLTIDLFRRYAAVTFDLARLPKTDPAYITMKGIADLPLDAKIQRMDAAPSVVAILKSHGISAKEMMLTSTAVAALIIVKTSIQTGANKNDANKLEWEATPPDHLRFYDTNQAEMKKFQDDLMKAVARK